MKTLSFRYRGGCARVGAWHGRDDVAALALRGSAPPVPTVERMVDRLRALGIREIVTAALHPATTLPFVDTGFTVRSRLHLLAHPLNGAPVFDGTPRTRRARRSERAALLAVDQAAFDEFWYLDERALRDAMQATAVHHLRVIDRGTGIDGFVLLGRTDREGYIQRLAVHPRAQGQGVGRALVAEGLEWLRADGAARALVNTQEENARALALYQRAGFERLPVGLCVLERQL